MPKDGRRSLVLTEGKQKTYRQLTIIAVRDGSSVCSRFRLSWFTGELFAAVLVHVSFCHGPKLTSPHVHLSVTNDERIRPDCLAPQSKNAKIAAGHRLSDLSAWYGVASGGHEGQH